MNNEEKIIEGLKKKNECRLGNNNEELGKDNV